MITNKRHPIIHRLANSKYTSFFDYILNLSNISKKNVTDFQYMRHNTKCEHCNGFYNLSF